MTLIKCEECGKEVSDKAPACPHCGAPLSAPVTIEQTAKKWKLRQLLAFLLIPLGTLIMLADGEDFGVFSGVGLAIVVIGVLYFIAVACIAWWHHG